jgi:hypothetical protein
MMVQLAAPAGTTMRRFDVDAVAARRALDSATDT